MSATVWKYPIDVETDLTFPAGEVIHVNYDPQGQLCAWVRVHDADSATKIARRITIVGTGHALPPGEQVYVNTFMRGWLVLHAFVGWPT